MPEPLDVAAQRATPDWPSGCRMVLSVLIRQALEDRIESPGVQIIKIVPDTLQHCNGFLLQTVVPSRERETCAKPIPT